MGARRCGLQHCGARLPAGWVGWVGANRKGEPSMFVFKAAVVGAGTMGGQIAQTVAAAGIPVVLKDIDDALVQAGLAEARSVTGGQVRKLVEKGRLSDEQGQAQVDEVLARIHGT